MRGVHLAALFIAAMLSFVPSALRADSALAVAQLKRSLAFVQVTPRGDGDDIVGSGFVVWQDDQSAYVVTAGHLFAHGSRDITIYLASDTSVSYRGTLHTLEPDSDVAIVQIRREPQVDAVRLSSVPRAGSHVYSIGYGAEALKQFLNSSTLAPVATIGAVIRADRSGRFVTSSRSERGQSGGPIVDDGGDVVGMVLSQPVFASGQMTRHNVAFYGVTASRIADVLAKHHVPFQGDFTSAPGVSNDDTEIEQASGPIREASDAGRLALAVRVSGDVQVNTRDTFSIYNVQQSLTNATAGALQQTSKATVVQGSLYGRDAADIARLASTNHAAGGVVVDAHVVVGERDMLTNRFDARIDVWVVGDHDAIWFHRRLTYEKQRYFPFGEEEVSQKLAEMVGTALGELTREMGDASGLSNLAHYGVPVGFGKRSAFVAIQLDGTTAHAVDVASAGVAGRAGLRDGDMITRINGKAAGEYASAEIETLLHGSRMVNLTVLGPDGRQYAVTFAPETIRWYVDHERTQH